MKICILDMNNLIYRTIYYVYGEFQKSLMDFESSPRNLYHDFRSSILYTIRDYLNVFNPNKFIISIDSKRNWRKEIYKKYKEGRSEKRDASPIDFKQLFKISDAFIEELKEVIPCVEFLLVENCETDDNIAILCKYKFPEHEVIIISTDQDHKQLMVNPNIKCWDPTFKVRDFMKSSDPLNELNLKVVCGDGGNGNGDNIPNIMVMEEQSFEGRTIGCGDVTANGILENGITSKFTIDKVKKKYPKMLEEYIVKNIKNNYERNLKLISFEYIPKEIKEIILNEYEKSSGNKSKYSGKTFNAYLIKNGYNSVYENFQVFNNLLYDLI